MGGSAPLGGDVQLAGPGRGCTAARPRFEAPTAPHVGDRYVSSWPPLASAAFGRQYGGHYRTAFR